MSLDVDPVMTTGADNFASSTERFPYYNIDADGDGVIRGVSALRRIDGDTIELESAETGGTFWLVRQAGDIDDGVFLLFAPGPDGIMGTLDDQDTTIEFVLLNRNSSYFTLRLSSSPTDLNGFDRFAVNGGFGYETEVMPEGTAFYNIFEGAEMLLTSNNSEATDPAFISLVGSVDLFADFGNRTITGSVFTGTNTVELDDVGEDNDDLFIDIELNGVISGNKISGTVSANSASVDLNGSNVDTPLMLSLTNTGVSGQFFGTGAEAVNGTWGADYTLSNGTDSVSGEAVGFFEAPVD